MEQLAQVCYQRRSSPPRHAVPEVSASASTSASTHTHSHTSLAAPYNHFPTYSFSPYPSTNPSGSVFDRQALASPQLSPTYGSNPQHLSTHPLPPHQQQHLLPSLMTVIRPFPSTTATVTTASTSPQALNEMFSLCLPASISASPPSVSSITFAARTRRRSRGAGVEQEATANKKTELPMFIAEGFIDDIGSITYQTRLQSRGETVPFLFSDNTAPFVGQHVFIEVRFREAMTETDSSSLVKTVVSRLEGEICKTAPQVVARVRVVEKLVKELAGEWEVTLLQDLSLTKHKWRVSAMRPAPSETTTTTTTTTVSSSPSPLQSSSESSSSSTTSSPSPKQAPSVLHRSNLATTSTTSNSRPTSAEPSQTPASESSSGPSRKKRKTGTHSVVLSEEVLEKLREFKARNFDDSAVANWDLSQYSTVPLSSRESESPSPQVQR